MGLVTNREKWPWFVEIEQRGYGAHASEEQSVAVPDASPCCESPGQPVARSGSFSHDERTAFTVRYGDRL